ncbi:hypothetical protein MN116_005000 [Schistosoma mekongi]|uniref:Stress protein DDR48 (DNA damage-responsive protein 48) n=1 Tax=Schistosoma mekongi TaxID=38744 RepID=A0AAE1ZD06_SCHME|nr:hypothetical protein MN116_005000 [Schistosoma mekongi]
MKMKSLLIFFLQIIFYVSGKTVMYTQISTIYKSYGDPSLNYTDDEDFDGYDSKSYFPNEEMDNSLDDVDNEDEHDVYYKNRTTNYHFDYYGNNDIGSRNDGWFRYGYNNRKPFMHNINDYHESMRNDGFYKNSNYDKQSNKLLNNPDDMSENDGEYAKQYNSFFDKNDNDHYNNWPNNDYHEERNIHYNYRDYNYENNENNWHEENNGYEQYGNALGNEFANVGYERDSISEYSPIPYETYEANGWNDDGKNYHDDHNDKDHYNYFKDFDRHFHDDNHNYRPSHKKYSQRNYQYFNDRRLGNHNYNNYQHDNYEHYQPQRNGYDTNWRYGFEDDDDYD